MNKVQSGLLGHGQILLVAEINLRPSCSATTSICVVALELPRLVAPDMCPPFHTRKLLLLFVSDYITWAPSIRCCLIVEARVLESVARGVCHDT